MPSVNLQVRETQLEADTSTLVTSDMVYVMFCAFGVFLITPAIALYYTGVMKRKSSTQVMFQSYMTTATVTIVWYLFGYSMAVSPVSGSKLIGDLNNAALHNDGAKPLMEGGTIPSVINFCFNVFFPVATVQIFVGAIGERGRFLPSQVVGVLFVIFVYTFEAYWVWGLNGFLYNLGALDFAGGGPVHISSGVASLCYSWYLGPRGQPGKRTGSIQSYRGHNTTSTFIGVTLIWAAWFCFNSGTLLAVNVRTGYIFLNTILASTFASFSYVVTDKLITGKYSANAACHGAVAGLVAITPSCGFFEPWAAAVSGVITAVSCRLLLNFNTWTGIDDYSYSGVIHGIGGIIGDILTGIFASKTVAGYDGITEIDGGWVDQNYIQLGYQLAGTCSIVLWTFVFTMLILVIVDHIPGLKLRASPEEEERGMDLAEMSETIDEFGNDYDEFLLQYATRLRSLADSIDNTRGTIEILEGTSADGSESVQSVREKFDQKV